MGITTGITVPIVQGYAAVKPGSLPAFPVVPLATTNDL
jgi:hypothetical protein